MSVNLKIGHFSDIHADYSSTRKKNSLDVNVREQDGYDAFEESVTDAIEQEIDVAIICGDLFHSHMPSMRSIYEVQKQLRRFSDAGISVYTLAGNHDVSDIKSDVAASKIIDDPYRKIYSHSEPYVHYEISPGVNLHMVSHHMYEKQLDTMKNISPVKGEVNIFATHGSVVDPLLQMVLHTEKSPREVVIPDFLLQDYNWDYVMLGHIHERGWVCSKDQTRDTENRKIYYNGSLIRRGFSDKDVPLGKGWTLWTIDSSGKFKADPRQVHQRPQKDFPIIRADKMSSMEITDRIIRNLRRENSGEITQSDSPILRQRISGITPSKYNSLDRKAIFKEAEFALDFKISKISKDRVKEEKSGDTSFDFEAVGQNSDLVKAYNDWVESSEQLKTASKELRESIEEKSRSYISKSQEEAMNNDE